MTVKDFIVKCVNDIKSAVESEHERLIKAFIECPQYIHHVVRHHYQGDIALFEVPCPFCGKPMLFTHKDRDWESETKPILLEAFKVFCCPQCYKQRKEESFT